MKEVSLKSLIFDLNLMVFKNNPSENQIVGSIGPECYNSKKALFFDIMPKNIRWKRTIDDFILIDSLTDHWKRGIHPSFLEIFWKKISLTIIEDGRGRWGGDDGVVGKIWTFEETEPSAIEKT
jgi:hypothetical protein